MTEVQKITLRDTFRQAGLAERKIEDIMLLLRFKPEGVRLAFYHKAVGVKQERSAEIIGVSQGTVSKYVSENCAEIYEYLKNPE